MMYGLMRGFGQYYVDGVGYATIEAILARDEPLAGRARRLLDEANRRGTEDNVAIVVARWGEETR